MQSIEQSLLKTLSAGFQTLFNHQVETAALSFQKTRKEFTGELTFVVFPFLKISKKGPPQTAEALGDYLTDNNEFVAGYNVVKGFLNIELTQASLLKLLKEELQKSTPGQLALRPNEAPVKTMIEYSSPNTNKPLHLGHLRNNFLGWSVAEILKAAGQEVTKVNLVNDRGIHICKSMVAYQQFGHGETPDSSGKKGDHLVGHYYVVFDQNYKIEITELMASGKTEKEAKQQASLMQAARIMLQKWEQNDAETVALWQKMNGWVYSGFDITYKAIGVDFDKFYYESGTYLLGKDLVQEGLKQGVFYSKEDGSVWIDLTADGLDEKLLLRGDGTSVYMTQDMGTSDLKFHDFGCDRSLYVVGNEQDYHFKVLFLIMKKLGRSYAEGMHHISYGMVDLPHGKMKSREGTVVDADDLVAEMQQTAKDIVQDLGKVDEFQKDELTELYRVLALGALKYFILKVDPRKRMVFNPEESVDFHGHTGPFVQYTYARLSSLLRKGQDYEHQKLHIPEGYTLHETERAVVLLILELDAVVKEAADNYSPALVAQYVYDLAKAFNRIYAELSILNDEALSHFRLTLAWQTARIIKRSMGLLGIEVPNRM